jgi:hypothetical protein
MHLTFVPLEISFSDFLPVVVTVCVSELLYAPSTSL